MRPGLRPYPVTGAPPRLEVPTNAALLIQPKCWLTTNAALLIQPKCWLTTKVEEGTVMQTYRIVVGVDGSQASLRALSWAVAEADRRGATVQAVTAWQCTQPDLGADLRAEHEKLARLSLDDAITVARRGRPDVTVAAEAVAGPAADVLTRAAANADLLVLGSHGHGRLFHAVLGSVAEQCIRAAVCPVVVVPVPQPATSQAEPVGPITTAMY